MKCRWYLVGFMWLLCCACQPQSPALDAWLRHIIAHHPAQHSALPVFSDLPHIEYLQPATVDPFADNITTTEETQHRPAFCSTKDSATGHHVFSRMALSSVVSRGTLFNGQHYTALLMADGQLRMVNAGDRVGRIAATVTHISADGYVEVLTVTSQCLQPQQLRLELTHVH